MRALVTGFDPFGGEATNASSEAVRRLPSRIADIEITTAILPTSYARAPRVLRAAIERSRPRLVLCVGQAGDRSALNVERVAINLKDASQPDNDGSQPIDKPIVARGIPARFATLPVREVLAALQAAGLPAEISNSAGTFVCNHVFYALMRFAASKRHGFSAGFLHVPRITAGAGDNGPALPLADIVRGIEIVLEVGATTRRKR